MKSPEELHAIKAESEALNDKLSSLTEEELSQVAGGIYWENIINPGNTTSRALGSIHTLQDSIIFATDEAK